jgi:hypothetical protein
VECLTHDENALGARRASEGTGDRAKVDATTDAMGFIVVGN